MTAGHGPALFAAFIWGIASILLSPCHLSSIPLIVGFLTMSGQATTSRNLVLSLLFAVGILLTILLTGIITAAMGRMLGDIGPYGKYPVAVIFVVVGLYLMDLIRLPDLNFRLRPLQTVSPLLSALILGLLFGLALGPCTFAFMAPILGVVFQLSGTDIIFAGGLLLAFAIGHCAVIVGVGALTTRIQHYLDWTNRSRVVVWIKRVAGALVIIGGVYIVCYAG